MTMAVGIIILFVLPDFPHTWKKLSPELKHVANRRMAIDASEADVGTSTTHRQAISVPDIRNCVLTIR